MQSKETLPKGKYFIGDPSYCLGLKRDEWIKILEETNYFKEPLSRGRRRAVAFDTAYGDGAYLDQEKREYPVDTGMIGCIPASLSEDKKPFGMHLVRFEKPFECYSINGKLHFGHIIVDTDPEPENDDEY